MCSSNTKTVCQCVINCRCLFSAGVGQIKTWQEKKRGRLMHKMTTELYFFVMVEIQFRKEKIKMWSGKFSKKQKKVSRRN